MSDDILDNVVLVIALIITGGAVIAIGIVAQSGLLIIFGGILAGGIPILALILKILETV